MTDTPVSAAEFAALPGLDDWRYVLAGARAQFRTNSYAAAASLVSAVAAAADAADLHPDFDVRQPDRVAVVLFASSAGALTARDLDLAREISRIAGAAGATPEPTMPQAVEIAIDTLDADRVRPFWAAVLGYRDEGGTLVDPLRLGPPVWFQQMAKPRTGRGRFHIDVSVPHDVAQDRVAAALAAGGTLVTDRFARSWWVLADADGNEVCVSTWQDRS